MVFDVHVFYGTQLVPERQPTGDDKSDENADRKKETITRKGDEEDSDDSEGNDKTGRAFQCEPGTATGNGFHASILAIAWFAAQNRGY